VRESSLTLPHWPVSNDGLRIAVLADLHVGSPHHGLETLRRIVARVNELQPDAVLLLGDLVIQGVAGGTFVPPETLAAELGLIRSRVGTFAVLGNHDWWLDSERVADAVRSAGITLLEDTAQEVQLGSARFWLAGVSDYWEGRHDVAAALAQVPAGDPVIAFTHNPDIFPEVPGHVALTIAGHTHGGQVDLPLLGPPIVPSKFGQRYASGHVVEDRRHLFVSTGTGTSILPVRFRVPPEITVLVLRSSHSRDQ
jgi:predicted MPP superfamily phosphohydrolase